MGPLADHGAAAGGLLKVALRRQFRAPRPVDKGFVPAPDLS